MYRKAQRQDTPALLLLWRQVFGDDDAFILRCLDIFAGPGQVYVAAEQDGLDAMLLAVPCEAGARQGAYLYALATRPQKRGAGVMSGLMQYAEQAEQTAGAQFAVLIPANDGLYPFYRRRGYETAVCLRQICRQVEELVLPFGKSTMGDMEGYPVSWPRMDDGTAQRFSRLRARHIHLPYICFSAARALLVWQDMAATGARLAECGAGYSVYFASKYTLLVAELFAENQAAADLLLREICHREQRKQITITLPQASPLYAGTGENMRSGLVKYFTPSARQENLYLRFALDEIIS